jgi:hypothetical protein
MLSDLRNVQAGLWGQTNTAVSTEKKKSLVSNMLFSKSKPVFIFSELVRWSVEVF